MYKQRREFCWKSEAQFSTSPEYNYNFTGFTAAYANLIDKCCLCTNKPNSKRNVSRNPCITPWLVNSIKRKHILYKNWKNTVSKKNRNGNCDLYLIYKNYRKTLKHVIRDAKKYYYGKEFGQAQGNMKTMEAN